MDDDHLLPPNLIDILRRLRPTITNYVSSDKIRPLLDLLEAQNVLVENERDAIKSERTTMNKLSDLVSCLMKGTIRNLRSFVQALENDSVRCQALAASIKKEIQEAEPDFVFSDQPAGRALMRAQIIPKSVLLSNEAKKTLRKQKMPVHKNVSEEKYIVILDMLIIENAIVQQEYDRIINDRNTSYEKAARLVECLAKGTVTRLRTFLEVLELEDVGCEDLADDLRSSMIRGDPMLDGVI